MTERLNWGCASDVRDGWTNSDQAAWPSAAVPDHIGDIFDGLPFPDGHFGYAVTNHALQMIPYHGIAYVLGELRRVIAPGGTLRILVPDLLGAVSAFERGEDEWFPIVDEAETSTAGKLCAYVAWYGECRQVFTPSWLAELLDRNGFEPAIVAPGVTAFGPPEICDIDSRPVESIIAEGRRRD